MSSYFDGLAREVREARERFREQENFEAEVVAIERRLITDVTLCVGDREFPDDLRQQAMKLIAAWHVGEFAKLAPQPEAIEWLRDLNYSRLIEEMHSLFHRVAQRRIRTRFGLIFDDPAATVRLRDEHDRETP